MYSKPLRLSPFTLDDFEAALAHRNAQVRCSLLIEIFTSIMNIIIREKQRGNPLPLIANEIDATLSGSDGYNFNAGSRLTLTSWTSDSLKSEESPNTPIMESFPHNDGSGSPIHSALPPAELAPPDPQKLVTSLRALLKTRWDAMQIPSTRRDWERTMLAYLTHVYAEVGDRRLGYILSAVLRVGETSKRRGIFEEALMTMSGNDRVTLLMYLTDQIIDSEDIRSFINENLDMLAQLKLDKREANREKRRM